jgi:hypothetical protein
MVIFLINATLKRMKKGYEMDKNKDPVTHLLKLYSRRKRA